VEAVDAAVLSWGSVYGLAAARFEWDLVTRTKRVDLQKLRARRAGDPRSTSP